MKSAIIIPLIALCLTLFLSACGSKQEPPGTMPPPSPVDKPQDIAWIFQKNAISIVILASEDLNMVQNEAHAVSICLYQAESPDLLKTKAETEQGLRELLLCKSNPPERIQAQRIYVQPGRMIQRQLDRAEKAKYFAVVAGFDVLRTETCFSIIPIPVQKGTRREWLILTTETFNAAEMEARIDLSSESVYLQGIERVQE